MCQERGWLLFTRLRRQLGSSARRWIPNHRLSWSRLTSQYQTKCNRIMGLTLILQMGRAGRGGDQSVCIFLRKKGERTPPEMKPYLRQDSSACLKRGMVEIFTLKDVDGEIQLMHTFMPITWARQFSLQWSIHLSKRWSTAAGSALPLAGANAPNACKWNSDPPPP